MSPIPDPQPPIDPRRLLAANGLFWEARTRILLWYAALMLLFVAGSIPVFRVILFNRVDARVREDMQEEVTALRQDLAEWERQGKPGGLKSAIDTFLERRIPEDENYSLIWLDGEFYRSNPAALPKPLRPETELMRQWAMLDRPVEGERELESKTFGSVLYLGKPIVVDGKLRAVLVVAHTTAGEREEVLDAVWVFIAVAAGMLVVAFVLAWLATGKVLAPVRKLAVTARSIGESDLAQRLPVTGSGEMASLATAFNGMMDRLQESFESQRSFMNDASHELQTPITIVRGHLELLIDDCEEHRDTLELTIDELDRMSRFVDDLLFLVKVERPDFLKLGAIDVDVLTEEMFAKAKALADRNWCLDAVAVGQMTGDRQRITQAVMNLANNATQHTQPGNTIALGSVIQNGEAHFWVRDTGEGIAPEDQQRIFQRFARAKHSRRRSEGAGLGLAIVSAIAQAQGGRVELSSQLGQGSTFTLVIPLRQSRTI